MLNRTIPSRRAEPWNKESERVDRARRALVRHHGNVVGAGPFAGMDFLADVVSGTAPPKLVGSYEQELSEAIERMIGRNPARVVNVGCADGYYAVGFARRLPEATVFAFDIDDRAREACRRLAARNGVSERVKVAGECTGAALDGLLAGGGLVVIDCEGCEGALIDPAVFPNMAKADWIIESHDCFVSGTTDALRGRLAPTHDVEQIEQQARDPRDYPRLEVVAEPLRMSAIDERRQPELRWLVCAAASAVQDERGAHVVDRPQPE